MIRGATVVPRFGDAPANGNGHATAAAPKDFPQTDIGNAERMLHHYGDVVRYVPRFGRWIANDGRRWGIDEAGAVDQLAKLTARAMKEEAAAITDARGVGDAPTAHAASATPSACWG